MNSSPDGSPPSVRSQPARRTIDLSTLAWRFGSVPQQPWPVDQTAGAVADMDRVGEWLIGTVPGTVQSDLLALGRIPDPFHGDALADCHWVENLDWWYRTRVPLQLDPGQRAFLEFDGIDTLSAIYLDGQELARHEGMFSRQVVEIPPSIAQTTEIELAVRLWGSAALPHYELTAAERTWARVAGLVQRSFRPFDDRLAALKAPMHFGWDFAPRLRTMGLWDDARLVVCRGVYLADAWVQAEPLTPVADPAPARVRLVLTLDSDQPRPVAVSIAVTPATFTGEAGQRFDFAVDVPAGRSRHVLSFDLATARRWHPWERGEACLYEAAVSLHSAPPARSQPGETTLLDGDIVRFGVRTIERQAAEEGHPWQFAVNGQPLFLRGANWVPVDALWGRARQSSYEPLLRQAKQAGVNFLRVWGGGGREKRAFYDLCDEMGLLVWQEFPIACVFLDHLPRTARFQRLLRQETAGIARALRSHPSLFLWCGGNEFSPSRNRQAVSAMSDVVAVEDGSRPFVAASPSPGDAHHWQVWHGKAPLATYRAEQAAFVSEFGLQAAPDADSLRRFLSEDSLWPPGPAWEQHKADLGKLRHYAQWFEEGRDITTNGRPTGRAEDRASHGAAKAGGTALESFVVATQAAQAAGIQVLVEHVRRRRGWTGGLAVWQWNDPWPAISWSVIDFFGRPKLAYETLRRIYQPVMVCLEYSLRDYRPGVRFHGTLWVINDGLEALQECHLSAWIGELRIHAQRCTVSATAATPVGALALVLPAGLPPIRLTLEHRNTLLASNVYDLRTCGSSRQRLDRRVRRRLVNALLG